MGVHGFTTFVEGNRNFLSDVRFRGSRLVVDGSSLYFNLYLKHGLDRQHGGDYDAFASLVHEFLTALEVCGIEPYVVLDGGIDPSNKKFDTLQQRLQSRIKEAENISQGRNGSVLPILTRQVFIEVLIQEGVSLVQCLAEADWDIACLAHQWRCPVLSNDSDFFIFDLPGGYMPLNFFQWTNINGKALHRYIPARCYTTKGLCHFYGGMNPELLPLCAVLTGNDYGTPTEAETLRYLIDKRNGSHKSPSSRIDVLLRWLSSFSSSVEALAEVRRLMRENSGGNRKMEKGGLSSQLQEAMNEYHVTPHSPLTCWFTEYKVPERHRSTLPQCLSAVAIQGCLAPLVVDALVMRRVLLNPQVENSRQQSSHCCARAIRQAIYGILLLEGWQGGPVRSQQFGVQDSFTQRGRGGQVHGEFQFHQQSGGNERFSNDQGAVAPAQQVSSTPICVEEFDRLNLNLKRNQVKPQRLKSHLHVDTLSKVSETHRREALFEVLRVDPSALTHLPDNMWLPVAVTSFWLQEAVPKPSELQLQALVLGMVYGEIVLIEQSGTVYYEIPVPKRKWFEERRLIGQLDQIRVRSSRHRLDVAGAHSFSQWQACLWSARSLNQLLLLPEVSLLHLFSGTMVHGVLNYLKSGGTVEHMLPEFSFALYSTLLHAVKNCSSKPRPSSGGAGRGRGGERGRRGRGAVGQTRGRGRGPRRRGNDGISNRFAALELND
ncbi:protein asteroid homolog 1 [Phyllopteryx taeniolatus]|uniref:protein asteroid homolog 1 n=1 Tax=Phyllopteryx taeniolatus TaxID=161469 RepID=UPI002AD54B22|nr:protein asteroid homolog 1 [Phyllopteryx taeniolatus]XP_061615319.1 protein asteroid homolog 1 [Phyllopteryx taeniolatus]XP_061615320.1 protein asteroid homolog 1 [Phyllopteryx taeniolatus]